MPEIYFNPYPGPAPDASSGERALVATAEAVVAINSTDDFTGPVNLGNPGEFTIQELAAQVLELTGSKSRLDFMPLPDDDPRQRKPDIALAKDALGWELTVKLRGGLMKTIEYFDEYLSGRDNFCYYFT